MFPVKDALLIFLLVVFSIFILQFLVDTFYFQREGYTPSPVTGTAPAAVTVKAPSAAPAAMSPVGSHAAVPVVDSQKSSTSVVQLSN
jgi:hypothetical protein